MWNNLTLDNLHKQVLSISGNFGLQDHWKIIPGDDPMKLNDSTPRVCKTVIKAKGGYFKESKM